jgi:SNF2 family DNA or RNA helicase
VSRRDEFCFGGQVRGFQWLVSNLRNGFGAVLADDMGLG